MTYARPAPTSRMELTGRTSRASRQMPIAFRSLFRILKGEVTGHKVYGRSSVGRRTMHADRKCDWPVDSSFPTVCGLGACPKSDGEFCRSDRVASRYLYVTALHVFGVLPVPPDNHHLFEDSNQRPLSAMAITPSRRTSLRRYELEGNDGVLSAGGQKASVCIPRTANLGQSRPRRR